MIVFKTPSDNRTDYIKRLIGFPGDEIQFINSDLYINQNKVQKIKTTKKNLIFCGNNESEVFFYEEVLSNIKKNII